MNFPPRRFAAVAVSQIGKATNLIQRNPVFHFPVKRPHHRVGIFLKSRDRDGTHPPAAILQRLRQIPMEKSNPRSDPGLRHRIEQPVIKIEPRLIQRAIALRINPRPRQGQPVIPDAELTHQRKILLEAVIVVAGHIQRVTLKNFPRHPGKTIPD